MSHFQFYENCTFCQSRIGSTHCLLPYQLVVSYVPPEDDISRIMDITEIHMTYGIEMLTSNFQSIQWIANRPHSRQSTSIHQSLNAKAHEWSEQISEVNVSLKRSSTNPTTVDGDESESSYSDFIASQLDEGALLNEEAPEAVPQPANVTYAEVSSSALSDQKASATPAKYDDVEPESTEPKSVVEKYEEIMTRDDKNHLIQDLVIIAKVAFNIHAAQRGWIKMNSMKESLMRESELRSVIGRHYQPQRNTTLDGDKALAKALIAEHSAEEIQAWESGKMTKRFKHCVLNSKLFSLTEQNTKFSRLGENLVSCFVDIIRMQTRTDGSRDSFVDAIKFDLAKNDHPTTFEWIKNRYTFLENGGTLQDDSHYTDKDGKSSSVTALRPKKPYPAVDSRLVDYVNTNLQVIVNRTIESFGDDIPTMNDGIKPPKFFYKLASDFFFRNKGWHNENSFTAPQHLTKLEESCGLITKSSESLLTFRILKGIIDEFRSQYKDRIVPRYLVHK